ncbi:MAG TPA: hypothetical protein DCL45_02655 [Chloroflexi bacterium]|nr:hypothetical protein [Chloroflexota bacterium]
MGTPVRGVGATRHDRWRPHGLVDDAVVQDEDCSEDDGEDECEQENELAQGGDDRHEPVLDPLAHGPEDARWPAQGRDWRAHRQRHRRVGDRRFLGRGCVSH